MESSIEEEEEEEVDSSTRLSVTGRSVSPSPSSSSILHFAPHPDDVRPECPTCKGRGVVECGDSSIALISLHDARLRPKRTKLHVGLSVFVCLLLCSLLIFFLFERTTLVKLDHVDAVHYQIDNSTDEIAITYAIYVKVYNNNYVSVTYHDLVTTVEGIRPIGNCSMNSEVSVSGRSSRTLECQTIVKFSRLYGCQPSAHYHQYSLIFGTSIQWNYLSIGSGVAADNDWNCFVCRPHSKTPNRGTHDHCSHNVDVWEDSQLL